MSDQLKTSLSPDSLGGVGRYLRVFTTYARNSLVRDMSFRMDFVLQSITSISWALMNFVLFKIIYRFTTSIGPDTGWQENEFFVFLGTVWIINGLIQLLFMGNFDEFSDMIRMGGLDFALLKPIDTQFLISFPRMNWSQIPNILLGCGLVFVSLVAMFGDSDKGAWFSWWSVPAYLFFLACGVAIMYSVMISLASTSIWLGRNQNLYDFWFYITNFYRYPMEIYQRGGIGWALWGTFTFVVPILVVSNVPARVLANPLGGRWETWEWALFGFTLLISVASLVMSRQVFRWALNSYRSASS
ncbi:MAG: ABC-2 family transporter protein [Pirellulaceae bacterium]|jgi:ABC-2 type transport system permease protein|nr:ABC-2 family transporter protein [Pirellulaceae bacterium]